MSDKDTRTHPKLPVTGEVGSEGGSYADNTQQVPTFEEELGRVSDAREPNPVQTDGADVRRYPKEEPS